MTICVIHLNVDCQPDGILHLMEYQPAAATRNGNRKGNALKGKLINAVAYFREPQQE